VIAIGGIADHVHVLVRFHPMARISEVVQHAKGASSHLVTQVLDPGGFFKWQGYYGAFTVSRHQARHVRDYILRQEEHHLGRTTIETLERIFQHHDAPRTASVSELTDAQKAEIERRIAEHMSDPGSAIPYDVAMRRLRAKYG
jgi:putative addiction module component (TIGR02574 family)